MTGWDGKWPAKKSSAPVTFFAATSLPAGSCSTMRSTSTNGYWVGIWRTSRPISPELIRGGDAGGRRGGDGAPASAARAPRREEAYGLGAAGAAAGAGAAAAAGLAFSASSAFTITSRVMSKSLLIV